VSGETDPDIPAADIPPVDPYDSVEGLEGRALKDGLHSLVSGHRSFDYDDARELMYGRRGTIDVVDGEIECVYTGRRVVPDRTKTPGGFNTEHSWPRSDGADEVPAISDIHHIFPVDPDANSARGNQRYGNVNCARACDYSAGGSKLGDASDGSGSAFEVRATKRGDIARAHFYFSIRYELPIPTREEDDLRAWHVEDPPDEVERARNDSIERFQHNRNPFVDRPDFVALVDNF
jgi:endonuclease I